LFIEVNRIPPEGLRIDRSLNLEPIVLGGDVSAPVGPTRLSGLFRRARRDVVFRGTVEASVSLMCSRCTAPFALSVSGSCHRVYRPGPVGRPVASDREIDEEDLAVTPYDGERIDLSEIAQEQIYLMIPLKPLCRDACAGLCPRCGANRNLAPCGCPDPAGADPLTLKLPLKPPTQ
jgi:DUF177 domain-containing protein